MGDPTPEQVASNWNLVARRYGSHLDPMTALYAADAVELVAPTADDRVLDVASGFGAATLIAARLAGEVVAIDFSSEMCAALRERAQREGADNVTVHEMDAQALDLPADHFDAALSSFGAMICPDRGKAFAEMARVTRPGGRLAVSSWQAPPNNEWLQIFMTTVKTALPDQTPPTPPPFMELADPERLRSEVEVAGWTDVEVVGVTHRAHWGDADAAWAAIAESNPLFGPLLEQLPDDVSGRVRAAFGDLIDERGDAHLTAGAWVASGRA
jgi:SAM-dependent methyltransferase